MTRIVVFALLLTTVLAGAVRFGDRETQVAAVTCVTASILSAALVTFHGVIELGVAMVDVAVLLLFVGIALRTVRFWPLWVAGLQLTTVLGHVLRLVQPSLMDIAYAAAMRFWSYPILLIIIVASWRSHRYESPVAVAA